MRYCIVSMMILMLGLLGRPVLATDNIDPFDVNAQFAWSENTGWLNAEPGGDGGPGIFVEDDGLSGYLWSENTGWVSLSCLNNSVCGTTDYRVTNDGSGNLAGYAWSENAGWISFSCANTNACVTKNYGVTIDPNTGEFSGRAWSENTGWINFRNQTGTVSYGVTTSWRGFSPNLDIDGNDKATAQDGLLAQRYLMGLTGEALIRGVVDPQGTRTTAEAIQSYLDQAKPMMLDVDGNTEFVAKEDGILILRWLFGVRGNALIANALGAGATRNTPALVEAFLAGFMPDPISSTTVVQQVDESLTPLSAARVVTDNMTTVPQPNSSLTPVITKKTKKEKRWKKRQRRAANRLKRLERR